MTTTRAFNIGDRLRLNERYLKGNPHVCLKRGVITGKARTADCYRVKWDLWKSIVTFHVNWLEHDNNDTR